MLKVHDIDMEAVCDNNALTSRAEHIIATGEYPVFKSNLHEEQQKHIIDVTLALKDMKLNTDQTLD